MPDQIIRGSILAVRKGDPGPPGEPGQDGYSPAVTVENITGGHRVTITDANHPGGQVFNVMDGQDGADGTDGTEGVSPEVTVASITGGHSVTITDADHPAGQTFNVMDGAKGDPGPSIITEPVKLALLQLASKVAYIDDDGQDYYDDLYDALYPLTSISAVYTQSGTVYTTDTLESLKSDLVVTATYDGGSTEVIPSTDYTLSGSLTAGTSTITVSYGGKTDTFTVTVTAVPGTFTVTNTLTGATNSNTAATVTENTSYSGTITAASGYTLTGATVSITMGGIDITSSAYNAGTISIASVTGNIVISVSAVAVTLSSISAFYTQSGTVYDTDSLDSLKADLVVTATYSDSSTATVPSADYTLSGTLASGTSTITVSYGGKTDTFTVTVTSDPHLLYSLKNRTFTGTEEQYIDTGINLFAQDIDYTITCDLTQDDVMGKIGWRILTSLQTASPWSGFYYGSPDTTTRPNARIKWIYTTKDTTGVFSNTFIGRHRAVFTHEKGTGVLNFYYRNNNDPLMQDSVSATWSALVTENLHIGGVGDQTGYNFVGHVNSIAVYDYVFTSDEINAFAGVS